MKFPVLAALATFAILAGCATPSTTIDSLTEQARSRALQMGGQIAYETCNEQTGAFPVPADLTGATLPAGFSPYTNEAGLAYIVVYADDCIAGRVLDHELDHASEFWGVVPVIPTAEYLDSDVDGYAVALGAFVTEPGVAGLYNLWGFSNVSVSAGNVFQESLSATGARIGHSIGWDANFTVELTTTVSGLSYRGNGGVSRIFIVSDDGNATVLGALDVTFTSYTALDGVGTAVLDLSQAMDNSPIPILDGAAGEGFHYNGFSETVRHVLPDQLKSEPDEEAGEPDHGLHGMGDL